MDQSQLGAFLDGYPGGVSTEEGRALCRYAEQCPNPVIVEIGSFRGKSAVALAAGQARGRFAENGLVYCIEPHLPFTGIYGGRFGPENRRQFYEVMLETGFFDRVALVNLKSLVAGAGWREPIGLLFIDGDHSEKGTRADVAAWEGHVVPGGAVVFDDALDPAAGPCRLIAELLDSGRFERFETVGKMVALRKLSDDPGKASRSGKRILVACHEIAPAGGLYRFERVARILRRFGHEFAFLAFGETPQQARGTEWPVLSLAEAAQTDWDATMVPGAGFPDGTIAALAACKEANFGVRVQHVLNDRSRRSAFLAVNRAFSPHVVLFNNRDWKPGDFTDFQGDAFHWLEGAVDLERLAPTPFARAVGDAEPLVVGGLTTKNARALIEAVRLCDASITLRLFGPDRGLAEENGDLVGAGRLTFAGLLDETGLRDFYRGVDCVVHTDSVAGWANIAAEAMAAGVPLICTPHGTGAFAVNRETALVLERPTPQSFADAIEWLRRNPSAVAIMASRARDRIADFSWTSYAADLLRLIDTPSYRYYSSAPELGLHGKWPIGSRLSGLDPLFELCEGQSVCDFGAGDGIVSRRLLDAGAASVHGFEWDSERVLLARRLCKAFPAARFSRADLSDWSRFEASEGAGMRDRYDIVLYLGLHHHLPESGRIDVLLGVARRAATWLAVRTPRDVFAQDDIERRLLDEGFTLSHFLDDGIAGVGGSFLFRRA